MSDLKYARVTGYGATFEGRAFIKESQSYEEGIQEYAEVELIEGGNKTWQTFGSWDGWTIEEIPAPVELPTKRDAVIRINGESYWRDGVIFIRPWTSGDSEGHSGEELKKLASDYGNLVVLFEGTD